MLRSRSRATGSHGARLFLQDVIARQTATNCRDASSTDLGSTVEISYTTLGTGSSTRTTPLQEMRVSCLRVLFLFRFLYH
ncbi:hypothetical protein COCC4DRAFT_124877 [Bipolaris maydis ATCC 48331]|uniref:Uncharacterized protein n=2 Tax=Cochliobolus heterostrophus TaxID=5016 RepID=M2TTQ5_COCH5|nr:uncharacterized protein COCC4DRAFT_124877 [Bipolaris maydis ATCC 48331]EMD89894.1 hypothetical protein COCHEDRAFT_1195193 [Bipolaris maydis C5]ENI09893.1 hypothetical protein COCC4DRAFT_124877 [Bipolaris maydis ATCC 48331]